MWCNGLDGSVAKGIIRGISVLVLFGYPDDSTFDSILFIDVIDEDVCLSKDRP